MTPITEQQLPTILSLPGRTIIECWAPWCAPCKAVMPIMDEVSEQFADIRFYSLNIDEEFAVAKKYGVKSIPTALVFDDGVLTLATPVQPSQPRIIEIVTK